MPRQATRSAARGPLDKLRGPVRKMAEEVFSVENDRAVLKDEPLLNGLSELQTKQAIKVLETYCANVQRQGSGRIQNKAAYLMSLIQSYKLGPASGNPGSAQRLVERLSPAVRRAVEGVFDPVVDRVVLEDRALMELLAKVPEEQALAALKKYRATVQRRGRDAIDNRCGYLIGFLKQYQDGVAVVGSSGGAGQQTRSASVVHSNGDGPTSSSSTTHTASSAANNHQPNPSGARNGVADGQGSSQSAASGSGAQPMGLVGAGGSNGVRPISYLQPPVRKQLEKLFESGKDKAVLEDVGLIKQLARLGEEQALAALKNYKEASKHRRDIHNKSAYLMGILRGYIEGTTPISKAPWEGRGGEDGSESASATIPVAAPQTGVTGSRVRGRGRGAGPVADDVERGSATSVPHTQPTPAPTRTQQSPQQQLPPSAPPLAIAAPRELGGFTSAPAAQAAPLREAMPAPLSAVSTTPSTSPVASPPLGSGGGLFLGGIRHNGAGMESSQPFDHPSGLVYLDGSSAAAGSTLPGFGSQVSAEHVNPLRRASPHESLFGNPSSSETNGGQQHPLVGPGLLGGNFLANGGGSDRGLTLGKTLANSGVTSHGGVHAAQTSGHNLSSNSGLFGSGLLAGDEFGSAKSSGVNTTPRSPESGSAQGSTSGVGSSALSAAGSSAESPRGSDGEADLATVNSVSTADLTASTSAAGTSSCNDSAECPSSGSPRSREGTENANIANNDAGVGGMVDMLARLNLSKYVPVLAEAEVDMDALRLFGEDDLKDLGFPKGPRIKLLHEVQNLNFTPMA